MSNEDMFTRLIIQVLFLLLTLQTLAQSQNKYLKIIKNDLGENLIGVQVVNGTKTTIAISDENGRISLSSSYDSLTLKYVGHQNKTIYPSDKELVVVMYEEANLLNTIVVSENKRETHIRNSTISIEIIKPNLFINTAPTNLVETIGRINGVQVVDNQPSIRSGSGWSYGAGSRVQVLVDGVPLLSGDAGQPLWTFMPTEGVDGVEIIKGASSVIYGSSALNGIINVITKKPGNVPYTSVSLSTGIHDLPTRESLHYQGSKRNTISNLTVYHTSTHRGVGVSFGLNALNDQGYKMSDYDQRLRSSLGIRKTFSKKNFIVGLNSSFQQGKSGSFLLWESYDLGYTALDSNATDNLVKRLVIDPYAHWTTKKMSHKLNTRYLYINNIVDNGDPTTNQSNSSDLVYTEYQTRYTPTSNKMYIIGGVVATGTLSKSPLYGGNQKAKNISTYVQLDKKWNRLNVALGGRYEYFVLNKRTEGKPVFRAGANYKAAKFTHLRASFGQGYRFPSIAESFITTSVGPVSIFANDSLRSETGNNLELGIKQGFKALGFQMMLDAALFQMNLNDMMEFTFAQWGPVVPPLFGAGFKTLNTGKARVQGGELNLAFQRKTKTLSLEGFIGYTFAQSKALEPAKVLDGQNLTYLNTSSDTSNFALKYRPKHLAKADVMLSFKKWKVGFGLAYQSEVENIDAAFVSAPISLFVPGIQESIDNQQTSYMLLNVRLGYNFNKNWTTNLITSNITNREYAIRPADLGAPRSIRLQVTYTIDK